jgi:hypothetical protein
VATFTIGLGNRWWLRAFGSLDRCGLDRRRYAECDREINASRDSDDRRNRQS